MCDVEDKVFQEGARHTLERSRVVFTRGLRRRYFLMLFRRRNAGTLWGY